MRLIPNLISALNRSSPTVVSDDTKPCGCSLSSYMLSLGGVDEMYCRGGACCTSAVHDSSQWVSTLYPSSASFLDSKDFAMSIMQWVVQVSGGLGPQLASLHWNC